MIRHGHGDRGRRLRAALLASLLSFGASSCVLFPMVPWPEVGRYALGMTYREALAVTDDFSGGKVPPWSPWPPTAMRVAPPAGARDMRLVFTGQCVSAIEVRYRGTCESRMLSAAMRSYGPPALGVHGEHRWTDGVREVTMTSLPDDSPSCAPICMDTCAVTYSYARLSRSGGTATSTHGTAACRKMERRHHARFRVDPLHTFQRHALDEIGYLLVAD